MACKVECVQSRGGMWRVKAWWREPFEDLFEIAVYNGVFKDARVAGAFRDQVEAEVRAAYPASPSVALPRSLWCYKSSACEGNMGSDGAEFVVQ